MNVWYWLLPSLCWGGVELQCSQQKVSQQKLFFKALTKLNEKKVASCLIKNPQLVNTTDEKGNTPLHRLALMSCPQGEYTKLTKTRSKELVISSSISTIVDLLFEKGGVTTIKNVENRTPLLVALLAKNELIAAKIIAHEQTIAPKARSVMLKDDQGTAPLFAAIDAGFESLILPLKELGTVFDGTNSSGSTVIHEILKKGWFDLAAQLIRLGVPFLKPDGTNKYPIEVVKDETDADILIKKLFWHFGPLGGEDKEVAYTIFRALLAQKTYNNKLYQTLYDQCYQEVLKLIDFESLPSEKK